MFPWVYEFHWSAGHLIFLGVFFTVILFVFSTLGKAIIRSVRDFTTHRNEKIMWESAFEDLPLATRVCRHELSGEVYHRTCSNEFDCRSCDNHRKLLALLPLSSSADIPGTGTEKIYGLDVPLDRYYHRGHTWARHEKDGTVTVGLDDLGSRLTGNAGQVDFPAVGAKLEVNGTAWRYHKDGHKARILSPVDGTVVEVGGAGKEWYLRVKPDGGNFDTRHLLRGREVQLWLLREFERLQQSLATSMVGATLADGGVLVDNLGDILKDDIDTVWEEMFLAP